MYVTAICVCVPELQKQMTKGSKHKAALTMKGHLTEFLSSKFLPVIHSTLSYRKERFKTTYSCSLTAEPLKVQPEWAGALSSDPDSG